MTRSERLSENWRRAPQRSWCASAAHGPMYSLALTAGLALGLLHCADAAATHLVAQTDSLAAMQVRQPVVRMAQTGIEDSKPVRAQQGTQARRNPRNSSNLPAGSLILKLQSSPQATPEKAKDDLQRQLVRRLQEAARQAYRVDWQPTENLLNQILSHPSKSDEKIEKKLGIANGDRLEYFIAEATWTFSQIELRAIEREIRAVVQAERSRQAGLVALGLSGLTALGLGWSCVGRQRPRSAGTPGQPA